MPIAVFFLVLLELLVLAVPVGGVFGAMSFLPSIINSRFAYTMDAAVRSMMNGLDSFTLLAVPLFIF